MSITADVQRVLAVKLGVILPHLNERQRRLLLAAEARSLGRGGIRVVARVAGVREATVSVGIDELDAGAPVLGRVRRVGGGRKRAVEKDPGLLPALMALVEPDERGDPMSPLRWTTASTRRLAETLTRQGHRVSAATVGGLLREQGFSLQANAKILEGHRHPDRDEQFRYLNEQVKQHQHTTDPVISVDAKKKEQLGDYANPGRQWRPRGQPTATRSHDFPDPDAGRAVPYGIYDLTGNNGWVNVGTDHDTATFAVESIRRWWDNRGRHDHPHARRLLITADAGGSNSYRNRTWKAELATLAAQTGLTITVCHLPPGTSKWNKIEHRLFSHITHNWRGQPLTSHHVVVQYIAATTTRTGLHVQAHLDTNTYDLGKTVSNHQLAALPLHPHHWHPDWNYTLQPPPTDQPPTPPRPPRTHPDLTWLHHPALTGHTPTDWNDLITILTALHHQHPTRRGPAPTLTTADQLLITTLHHRFRLSQITLATLTGIRADTLNRHIQHTRRLLQRAGHTTPTTTHRIHTLDALYTYAAEHGATPPTTTKPTS
ncbi:ISAzo13 family transposase [Micromonospora sp. WMMA1923]|uniref:ISAzo13 family transposase n=1 Tax=Micromonospora sp. WMMA1923 TaxID=3404125 RepID=UPI003B92A2E5